MNDAGFFRKVPGDPPRPTWSLPTIPAPESEAMLPFAALPESDGDTTERGTFQRVDFGAARAPIRRIVVLKLDHFGDFVIGLPALRALRAAFPAAWIRLICGRWNEAAARRCGLVDEVRSFNFFPERPNQDLSPAPDPLAVFDAAAAGRHDLAIDLRVDEDTRPLLGRIDARLRCGIGFPGRFPLLDIALPDEHPQRGNTAAAGRHLFLPPAQFNSALPVKGRLHHFGKLTEGTVFDGPWAELPPGRLLAEIDFTVRGHVPGLAPAAVQIVAEREGGEVIASQVFGRRAILKLRHRPVVFEFTNPSERLRYGFRAYVTGRPRSGTVQFGGVVVQQLEAPPAPRLHPVELHVGEKLSLLVALVRERTADLYGGIMLPPAHPAAQPAASRPWARPPGRLRIAIAPFGNSAIRNWPASYYAELIALLLERFRCEVVLLGTTEQQPQARMLAEQVQSPDLVDLVGRTAWVDLQDLLGNSDLVICNNSGIAHQAAAVGARVLAIYSASHQPREWGPRGLRSLALTRPMPCSPCGFERLADCPAEHACMRQITPEYVLAQARALLADVDADAGTDVDARHALPVA